MLSRSSVPALAVAALAFGASANERHFAYTYETAVLPTSAKELEGWNTVRAGREDYYSRLEHRLEFETGVSERVMAAFYLNWRNTTAEDATGALASAFEWKGFSTELKWKISDPVADAVGFALYGEVGYNTDEMELELKTLFDKKVGAWLLAANLVGEGEFEAEPEEMELEEIVLEADLAAAYPVNPHFSLGLELRSVNIMEKEASGEMELEIMALYLGPTVAYHTESWWLTFALQPQLPALKEEDGGSILDLSDNERFNARLLFSFHI
jgi:hypothetical protein